MAIGIIKSVNALSHKMNNIFLIIYDLNKDLLSMQAFPLIRFLLLFLLQRAQINAHSMS